LLAHEDFTSSLAGIEGKRGFANVLATERDYSEITVGLSETWELLENTYKPFACGIVIHPTIDGCAQLRHEYGLKARDVASVELKVHPLVLELTGKTNPQVGLEGKFSVYHCAAVAIIDGVAGEAQFSDERLRDPEVIALRGRVHAMADAGIHEDAAEVRITLNDGRIVEKCVEHAIGSLARPMSDSDLEAKFRALCAPILPGNAAEEVLDACWDLDTAEDAGALAALTVPCDEKRPPRGSEAPVLAAEKLA
jgi:2-methylcitrate dehydratase PrpD